MTQVVGGYCGTDVANTNMPSYFDGIIRRHMPISDHRSAIPATTTNSTAPNEQAVQSELFEPATAGPSTQNSAPKGVIRYTEKKKRRGRIEKRRRDRMNHCLCQLRQLVPSVFEKQGSQKLEKAEVLQLTVDYLKFIHATQAADPHWLHGNSETNVDRVDYRSTGFRECATEADQFLADQKMDLQSPMRAQLISHLQCASLQQYRRYEDKRTAE